jgi:Flp pilus assembly protein TadG
MRAGKSFYRNLIESQSGAVAPLFGLCLIVLTVMCGVAIDNARGVRASSDAAVALDAAALATAKALRLDNLDDAELEALARRFFIANFDAATSADVTSQNVSAVIDRGTNAVTLTANLTLPTTLTAVLGRDDLDVTQRATAIYDIRNVELSMMLDVSGSMAGSKIADLKSAASELVDILLAGNANGSDHRIGIAPFSTAVNAGVYASTIGRRFDSRGRAYAGAYTTCITDRSGSRAFSDELPMTGTFAMRSSTCPTSTVLPLSSDADELKDHINLMRADGMTAGHLGISWAWYLLSPEWSAVWPSDSAPNAYDNLDYQKVAILMTDGQFNTQYESANGSSEAQSRQLCDNMKAQNMVVYTVGFQVPASALPILQYCATSPRHFFDARNGSELSETFRTIANRLSGLRIAS